jgi:adenylate cyclase
MDAAPGPTDHAGATPPAAPRLAAVVFTDVVGYSALMQRDESGTIERVGADLDRMAQLCAAHGGESLNTMGDGMMLAFTSAVQAVSFALEVQETFARRNAATEPADRLQHRIGVHLGDVYRVAGGHVAGDGVNIAARLEGSAPPGGICMSQTVHDTVKGKLAYPATFAGMRSFKNIAEPMPVWHLVPGAASAAAAASAGPAATRAPRRRGVLAGAAAGAAALATGAGWWAWQGRGAWAPPAGPRSIAVLPFANLGEDKESAYFADGVHEDLLTQLALLGQLKVVSRTSVMEYRKTSKKIPQIGTELGVGALVEGSVRRSGDVVRVTAQLLDARADKHLWAANYDRPLRDVLQVQSELATEIARALNVSLSASETQRLARPAAADPRAYDLYLRHEDLVRQTQGSVRAISGMQPRIDLLRQAVGIDPQFAWAWARLAAEHARARAYGVGPGPEHKAQAQQALARGLSLAPDDLQVRIEQATVHLHALDDPAGALRSYEQVLAQAPHNVLALNGMAETLNELGRTVDAVQALERALAVDARHAGIMTRLAGTYGRYRHYDRLLDLRRQLLALRPDDIDLRCALELWTYWKTGRWESYDAWRATLAADAERRSARVRNTDADRAIARGDFATVHRLIDLDAEDFQRATAPSSAAAQSHLDMLHVLAWQAGGEGRKAAAEAARVIAASQRAMSGTDVDAGLLEVQATMHALLKQREPAFVAFERGLAISRRSGNQYAHELDRRKGTELRALLGEHEGALEELKRQAQRPGFFIHNLRVHLPFASLWAHPGFGAIVADPGSNAPLALSTPFTA